MKQDSEKVDDKSWDELTRRPMKTVTPEQIEIAFAKALQELTGQAYDVDLLRIDMSNGTDGWFNDKTLIDFKVVKKTSKLGGDMFGTKQE
jgi:hypothetical protein